LRRLTNLSRRLSFEIVVGVGEGQDLPRTLNPVELEGHQPAVGRLLSASKDLKPNDTGMTG